MTLIMLATVYNVRNVSLLLTGVKHCYHTADMMTCSHALPLPGVHKQIPVVTVARFNSSQSACMSQTHFSIRTVSLPKPRGRPEALLHQGEPAQNARWDAAYSQGLISTCHLCGITLTEGDHHKQPCKHQCTSHQHLCRMQHLTRHPGQLYILKCSASTICAL